MAPLYMNVKNDILYSLLSISVEIFDLDDLIKKVTFTDNLDTPCIHAKASNKFALLFGLIDCLLKIRAYQVTARIKERGREVKGHTL